MDMPPTPTSPSFTPAPEPSGAHASPAVPFDAHAAYPAHQAYQAHQAPYLYGHHPQTPYRGATEARAPIPTRATPAKPAELVALALFVVLSDLLVYSTGSGVALALFFPLTVGILLGFARKRRLSLRFAVTASLLVLVSLGLAWQGSTFAALTAIFLLGSAAVTLRAKRTYLPDLAASVGMMALGAVGKLRGVFRGVMNLVGRRHRDGAGFPWRTVLVPLGAVVVFGGVFTLANPVIEAWGARLLAGVSLPSPVRPLFWLVALASGATLVRPAFRRAFVTSLGNHEAVDAGEGCAPHGVSMAQNTLVALNALFLAVNALDVVSLWAGRPPAGLGYTEYAHRGTAWLTFALFLSTLVLGAIFRGAFHFDPKVKLVRVLAYVWAAQNAVLALGTLRRIQLYVEVSGLTSLRILGIFGTTLVVVGLALVVWMVRSKRTIGWLVHRQLDAFGIFLALFVATPTDLLSTSFNVARLSDGQYAPLLHVLEKTDAPENVPALTRLLEHRDPVVRGGVAALLRQRRESILAARPTSVFTGSLARFAAADALTRHQKTIDALSSHDLQGPQLDALRKLAGLANADEQRFDYRERGGVRSAGDEL